MNFLDFNTIVDKCKREKSILFGLENDKIVNIYEIDKFEDENKIKLPEKYKHFLQRYGGGPQS